MFIYLNILSNLNIFYKKHEENIICFVYLLFLKILKLFEMIYLLSNNDVILSAKLFLEMFLR